LGSLYKKSATKACALLGDNLSKNFISFPSSTLLLALLMLTATSALIYFHVVFPRDSKTN
jgi:hypothetical protein